MAEETEPLQNYNFAFDVSSVSERLKGANGPNAWMFWNAVESGCRAELTNYKKLIKDDRKKEFHDIWALVTFWLLVAGVLFAAGWWGVPKIFLGYLKVATPPPGNGGWKLLLTSGAGALILGIVFCSLLVALTMSLGGRMIKVGMVCVSTLVLGATAGSFFLPNPWNWVLGTLCIVLTGAFFFLLWWIWSSLRLSEAVMDTAVDGLKHTGGAWGVLVLFLFVQLGWGAVWFLALAGINSVTDMGFSIVGVQTLSTEPAGAPIAPAAAWCILVVMLAVLLWGMANFNAVVGHVVSSSIARWASLHHKTPQVVLDAAAGSNACSDVNRAMGPAFGTLATANLIHPFTEPVRTMAALSSNPVKRRENVLLWAMGACISTCLSCFASSAPFMNRLVPAMVAIRGGSYCTAVTEVRKTLGYQRTGWISVFNRDWTQTALFGLTFVASSLSAAGLGVVAYHFGQYLVNLPGSPLAWALAAGIIGFVIVFMLVSMACIVFAAAGAAVFLCFFDAPYTMMNNRPRDEADGHSNSFIRLGSAVQATVEELVGRVDRREPMLV